MEGKRRGAIGLAVFVLTAISWVWVAAAPGQDYVGAGKCKMCHSKPHTIWVESGHAKALQSLKPEEQKNPQCLSCHASGYHKTQKVRDAMAGIECEDCHGPASGYLMLHPKKDKEGARKAGLIARPGPESCETCHNPQSPTFKGFEYDKMWDAIKHSK